jgi:hypothetical protein
MNEKPDPIVRITIEGNSHFGYQGRLERKVWLGPYRWTDYFFVERLDGRTIDELIDAAKNELGFR